MVEGRLDVRRQLRRPIKKRPRSGFGASPLVPAYLALNT